MIVNKCGRHNDLHTLKIGGLKIRSKEHVELLGIEIDFKLNFNKYVGKLTERRGTIKHTMSSSEVYWF